jgi:hypothetical protein
MPLWVRSWLISPARGGPSELPGVRPHGARYATYSAFDWRRLPPVPGGVTADYLWLSSSPVHARSSLARPSDAASRDLADWRDLAGQAAGVQIPVEFSRVVRDPMLRRHLRSATDCYFDLGDRVVEVPGGRLVHFLSDSQWVRHWLLFVGAGDQAVVTTYYPAGFELTPEDREAYPGEPVYEICAGTFLEFLWRFWIENEIWFALAGKDHPLTPGQQDYVNHYRAARS